MFKYDYFCGCCLPLSEMKKTAIFLLAICCSVFAEAQMMPDSTVQVVAYWSKGDVISYDCAVTQYTIEADGTKKADYSSSETRTIEVIDADDSSYTLRLSYADYEILKPMVRDYSIKVAKAALESTGTEFDENEIADEIDKQMAEESVNVTFDEYTTIQIHLGTGWPVCWYSTREVVSTSEQAEKTVIIEKSVELHTEQ